MFSIQRNLDAKVTLDYLASFHLIDIWIVAYGLIRFQM